MTWQFRLAVSAMWVCLAAPGVFADTSFRSSTEFLPADLKARQKDETENPGFLWIAEGAELWSKPEGLQQKSCASCHGDAGAGMKGVAARYPAVDIASGKLLNLELRIDRCRTEHQGAPSLAYESLEMLALTAFVTRQSRDRPKSVSVDGAAAPYYEKGRQLFYTRQGQVNLSCAHCHEEQVGRRLRGDIISSAASTGYPAYRLEWQTLGSLHRRLRACFLGVRARQFPSGSEENLSLELYLAKREEGMALEAPAIRK